MAATKVLIMLVLLGALASLSSTTEAGRDVAMSKKGIVGGAFKFDDEKTYLHHKFPRYGYPYGKRFGFRGGFGSGVGHGSGTGAASGAESGAATGAADGAAAGTGAVEGQGAGGGST
ncbi:hypothetical protein ACFX13_037826 [Malus domestica]